MENTPPPTHTQTQKPTTNKQNIEPTNTHTYKLYVFRHIITVTQKKLSTVHFVNILKMKSEYERTGPGYSKG